MRVRNLKDAKDPLKERWRAKTGEALNQLHWCKGVSVPQIAHDTKVSQSTLRRVLHITTWAYEWPTMDRILRLHDPKLALQMNNERRDQGRAQQVGKLQIADKRVAAHEKKLQSLSKDINALTGLVQQVMMAVKILARPTDPADGKEDPQ